MKQFYRQIHPEPGRACFFTRCEKCGKKVYGGRIPVLCRSERFALLCASGGADSVRQARYNSAFAAAVQELARYFNRCEICGSWVCDDCYDVNGACLRCAQKLKKSEEETQHGK